ncbi:hypothetical protein ACIBUY_16890 [Streptomyces sp. NPDC050085]|uniref:hypothetical protein n=1 Tax=Streptomyces sp. NPDC050085 TaxID=3365600 RepID=UPI0037905BCA
MSTRRTTIGVVASAALAVLVTPALAHADGGDNLTETYVPAMAKVNQPIDTAQLRSVPDAMTKVLDKLAMSRNDQVHQTVAGG